MAKRRLRSSTVVLGSMGVLAAAITSGTASPTSASPTADWPP